MPGQVSDVFLVLGGSGLLGRQIVELLASRGDTVASFDLVQRHFNVPFYHGDISAEGAVQAAIRKSGASCVFHTVSPHATAGSPESFRKVNIDGTRAVIAACIAAGVRKLIYTGSSAVVFEGYDLNGVDESYPYTTKDMGMYNESKVIAERAVLDPNGKHGLLTTVLRPSGIFGPGDRQLIHGLWNAFNLGRTGVQIGSNTNLTDWTYVTNVADAHILAADKLLPNADPPVAGEVFFITNDEPIPFWDFANAIWDRFDLTFGWILAIISEFISWIFGREPTFTRFNVVFTCTARWYNIEKAKKALGYQPKVSMSEGLDLYVDWWTKQLKQSEAAA